ncbi:MAG: FtsX-like permease family protein [Pseudomonadota bacterium]|nr:FtsX-like permease family protein [Pseudomonadota bacterium]
MNDFFIAARNLTRNRRRGITALLTIAIAVIAMVLADGFSQWIFWAMREGTIQSQLGHIQVERPGYHTSGAADPFRFVLPNTAPEFAAIEQMPGVKIVAPRVSVTGLVSHGDVTVSFLGEGVDPAKEAELSKAFRIVSGKDLTARGSREVILGRGLARNLGVEPGDKVALLANTGSGSINAVEATVTGIFITANQQYDDAALRLPIEFGQSLLRIRGSHVWLVLLSKTEDTDGMLQQMRTRFAGQSSRLAFVPWQERADFYNKTVALFSRQMNVLRAIIALIIVLSISNILVMNVLERTGEIGTLLAIGFHRRKVLRQFVAEGLLLGLIGGALGIAVGYGLALLISAIGIPMPPPPGMEEGYTGEIRITYVVLGTAFALALVTTSLAGLYPAFKASRVQIVDALRHNR